MVWKITRSIMIYFLILLGFALLLLLPREIKINHLHGMVFEANYPFNMDLIEQNISSFIEHIRTSKGLGTIKTGMNVSEHTILVFNRSIQIILFCFAASIAGGVVIGSLLFRFKDKGVGKILNVLNWLFSSIPDFFLYIAFQYILIKLIVAGMPDFNLYGNENWYSFILPAVALMLFPSAFVAKYIASSLTYESKQDYVRTSIAKGMGEMQILLHMLRNSAAGLLHQTQLVMLYILTSLPIIEKLSNYRGAGYHLLESILTNQDAQALALMIPFLFLMTVVITLVKILKPKLVPVRGGDT